MIYRQLFDSSVVNEISYQEISKFKVSIDLSMVVKSSERITFSYFVGKPTEYNKIIIPCTLHTKEGIFTGWLKSFESDTYNQ